MQYNFSNLSPIDFEDLARDLIGAEIGVRFEAFARGPDGGMDGRYSCGNDLTVLQAKHYQKSSFSDLNRQMKLEAQKLGKLSPQRYLLATSMALTPNQKNKLSKLLQPHLKSEADIYGNDDLCGLLRKNPSVEKSHIKLWLTSATMLERILNSGFHNYTSVSMEAINDKLNIFVSNPSLEEARKKLDDEHVLIISGSPGVGKTTLAEILAYAHIADDWEFNAIRKLEDGFGHLDDSRKQIFFFDDFLGRVALNKDALSQKDADLYKFINWVRRSDSARFILTTRAYIFEEAQRASEHLSNPEIGISKYLLDVGVYTRQIKAKILYNHLYVSDIPQSYIEALIGSDKLTKIIDHNNYNPRVIEWVTNKLWFGGCDADRYPEFILKTLDNPSELWDRAFREHLSRKCQHLLYVLFFSSEFGESMESLESTYAELHPKLCAKYGAEHAPRDFEEAVKILEGSFISILDTRVTFINPSIKDYLAQNLSSPDFLLALPVCATDTRWAKRVWEYGAKAFRSDRQACARFAALFEEIAVQFKVLPTWKLVQTSGRSRSYHPHGLSNTERIKLLLDWYEVTSEATFLDCALAIAKEPVEGLSDWLDGFETIELIAKLKEQSKLFDVQQFNEIADDLEAALRDMFANTNSDYLATFDETMDEHGEVLSEETWDAYIELINVSCEEVSYYAEQINSENELLDHKKLISRIGKKHGIDQGKINRALEELDERAQELLEESEPEETGSPNWSRSKDERDDFSDDAIKNLFSTLKNT